ncbi:Uncharacterised protein [Pseudomonas fluorescens]|uniref:BIG2 domain-containing protein n=1 Tax=Pseudomonas fluorescens TaxID=294 RepID=A0A3S4SSC9_PSEFL|nr:Ig-like domain-containing protein [Pseudomonas fluorescens]VEF09783.1 Uncharacterised protein [Pseudomonas fluorescens]
MNSPITNADASAISQVVVFPPEPGIGVLGVAPPLPIGYKLQEDGALGVNIHMVQGDRDGLLVYILAYTNMAEGDAIEVFIDTANAPVAKFTVTDAHFDDQGLAKNIPFCISATDMASRFDASGTDNKKFWYEVTRVSGNTTESSPPVALFYKYPAPGEADTDGGMPFNQGLKLPVSSESFIDKTVVSEGLYVTVPEYFNQFIGDIVVLAFGSLTLEAEVTALGDVFFDLSSDQLATLPPTNSLTVRYQIFDTVENSSGWSDALVLPFKPGVLLLRAPIFTQADPADDLHHDWLIGGPTTVLVTDVFAVDDVINLTLQGYTKWGDPVAHVYTKKMGVAARSVEFEVENERIRNLIGGCLRATYERVKGTTKHLSKPAEVRIRGTSQPLGLPVVEPLVDETLPVDTPEATVHVAAYWPLKPGAKVGLRWQATDNDGISALFIFQLIVADPSQPVVFKVPAKYISPYANQPLIVQNTITNLGEMEVASQLLELKFGAPVEIVLSPPFPVEPATVLIDPLGQLPTIRVKFPAAQPQDRARLIQRQAQPGSQTFPAKLLNQNHQANFVLERPLLVASQGTSLQLAWNLRRNEQRIATSPAVEIVVKAIAQEDERLPTPHITNIDGVIDVINLSNGNLLAVEEWPGQTPEQPLFLSYEGIDLAGNAVRFDDLEGVASGQEKGLHRPLPLEWLKKLKNESELSITFSVVFRRGAQPVMFPKQNYLVHSLIELQPLITSVKTPQNVDIPHNSPTIATSVVISGTASANQHVQILVDDEPKVTLTTDASGQFISQSLSGFVYDRATHIRIKALYGSQQLSPLRSFTVHRPLQANMTVINLNGYRVYTGWPETGRDFPGNTQSLQVFHGVIPIKYSSSNPSVATVDTNGKITGLRWGSAYITVQDRFHSINVLVNVSNVYMLEMGKDRVNYAQSINWINSVPGAIPLNHAMNSMEVVYGPSGGWPLPSNGILRMCMTSGCPAGTSQVWFVPTGIVCDPGQSTPLMALVLIPY